MIRFGTFGMIPYTLTPELFNPRLVNLTDEAQRVMLHY